MNARKKNLHEKLQLFSDYFAPTTVAQFNGHDVMVTKLRGPFVWHKHDDTDDFFLVIRGTLSIELRDRVITLGAGEMFIVLKGWNTGQSPRMKCTCCSSSRVAHRTQVMQPPQLHGN
jgi:mannose-6-phosphate isomerase-like protein (cupin superfamily)